jgi:hypothetical protein
VNLLGSGRLGKFLAILSILYHIRTKSQVIMT